MEKEIGLKEPKFPYIILFIVMGLWGLNLFVGFIPLGLKKTSGGEWGDIFGAVNALFSALAFLLIYHGIQMQRYEVRLAKSELEESKKQTKAQKAALDKQNEATEQQMFENTFFKLIDVQQKILEKSFYNGKNGISALEHCIGLLYFYENRDAYGEPIFSLPRSKEAFITHINLIFNDIDIYFGNYINSIIATFRYMINSYYSEPYITFSLLNLKNPELLVLCYFISFHNEDYRDIKNFLTERKALANLNLNDQRSKALLFEFELRAFNLITYPDDIHIIN